MRHGIAKVMICGLLVMSGQLHAAITYEERVSFLDKNRSLATSIGLMKFCKNNGLEKALMDKAARSMLLSKSEEGAREKQDPSRDLLQALDFHAVGVATGLKLSGIPEPAEKNICSLGVDLAAELLRE